MQKPLLTWCTQNPQNLQVYPQKYYVSLYNTKMQEVEGHISTKLFNCFTLLQQAPILAEHSMYHSVEFSPP